MLPGSSKIENTREIAARNLRGVGGLFNIGGDSADLKARSGGKETKGRSMRFRTRGVAEIPENEDFAKTWVVQGDRLKST